MSDNLYDLINFGELPNVNVVGNLISLYVTGNTLLGANSSTAVGVSGDMYVDGLFEFSNVGNIIIYGGNNGDVLTTDGNGYLSWTAGGGGISGIDIGYENTLIVGNATALNFRSAIAATDAGNSIANISYLGIAEIPYGVYVYGINDPGANIVTTPSNVSSFGTNVKSANFEVPKYIIGSNVGANYIWPYVQNTSTTANGYLANSTAPLQPANASILNITNGSDNWYVLDYSDFVFNGNSITVSTPVSANGQYCFYANADANIQILNFATINGNSTAIIANTTNMSQYTIKANVPTFVSIKTGGSISNCDGTGFLIRNMTGGTNVVTMSGYLIVSQDSAPPSIL